MHAFPPPYVPPEYQHCKYSEMPEPYKSDIDAWIDRTSKHYEAQKKAAKKWMLIAFAASGLIALVLVTVLA